MSELTIAFVNVVLDGDYQYDQELPLGLACLGSFLREKGYSVIFHQCFPSREEEQILHATEVQADVLAFQLHMMNYMHVRNIVEGAKKRNPDVIAVFGGPFLSNIGEQIMQREPIFDFVVVGEGENTLLELLLKIEKEDHDFEGIEGLIWRSNTGNVIRNAARTVIGELDTLPFPARDFFEDIRRDSKDGGLSNMVRLITSRGCVGKCNYCTVNAQNEIQKGKRWRGRSPKHVVDEIEYLSNKFGAWSFNFADSSFDDPGNLGKKRSREICEEIIRRKLALSAKIYLRCETMKNSQDVELLKLYKQAGIDVVIVGAESASDYELRFYEKLATSEDNLRMVTMLQELDLFYVLVAFIMFGPNSTLESLTNNVKFMKQFNLCYNINYISCVLILYRDSRLYHLLKQEGRVVETDNFWEPPKYRFLDPKAERLARSWENILPRYPYAHELSSAQINTANMIYRMTNLMNQQVLEELRDDYTYLKRRYQAYNAEFSDLQHDFFMRTVNMVNEGCDDAELRGEMDTFFTDTYKEYIPKYCQLYDDFVKKVFAAGFGLTGLVFKHFTSSFYYTNDIKRIS